MGDEFSAYAIVFNCMHVKWINIARTAVAVDSIKEAPDVLVRDGAFWQTEVNADGCHELLLV